MVSRYQENSEDRVHIVGLKEPNKFGLYDMLRNVREWCWDLYDEDILDILNSPYFTAFEKDKNGKFKIVEDYFQD